MIENYKNPITFAVMAKRHVTRKLYCWGWIFRLRKSGGNDWPHCIPLDLFIVQPQSLSEVKGSCKESPILGDPGAVSRAGRKGATQLFKHGRKSPWVPTLTGPFPNSKVNAGSWLGTKNALYCWAQSANSFSWVLFVSSYMTAIISPQ